MVNKFTGKQVNKFTGKQVSMLYAIYYVKIRI